MSGVICVVVNCASGEEAQAIGREAVRRRLAACSNIHAPIASAYRWQGALESAREVPLTLKTRAELFDALARLVAEMHSYETPCILGFAADRVNAAYADWIIGETQPARG